MHKFGECNHAKKFFRADHFRQHLKHSHAGTSGKWTNMLENACMQDEPLPEPIRGPERVSPGSARVARINEEEEALWYESYECSGRICQNFKLWKLGPHVARKAMKRRKGKGATKIFLTAVHTIPGSSIACVLKALLAYSNYQHHIGGFSGARQRSGTFIFFSYSLYIFREFGKDWHTVLHIGRLDTWSWYSTSLFYISSERGYGG